MSMTKKVELACIGVRNRLLDYWARVKVVEERKALRDIIDTLTDVLSADTKEVKKSSRLMK